MPNACRGPLGNPPQSDCLATSPSTHIFLYCIHLHHFRTLRHVLGVTENSLETTVLVTCCDSEGQFSPNSGYSSAAPLGVATDCNPKFESTCHQGMLAKPCLLRPFPGRQKSPPTTILLWLPFQITAAQLPEPSARISLSPASPLLSPRLPSASTCCAQPSAMHRSLPSTVGRSRAVYCKPSRTWSIGKAVQSPTHVVTSSSTMGGGVNVHDR